MGSRAQYEYQYDSLNRLTAIYEKGELIQKNVYNGLGCRVSRTGRGVEGTVSYYPDYADPYNRILMEKGDRERTYLWQEKELLGMPEEEWYVLTDILHTPVGVLDQRGETGNRYRYDEFGVPEQIREEEALPFGFTGYGKEAVESLYFANAREYNSENGSFLSRDLHAYIRYGDPGTLNLYQYVKGNPLRYVDYSGHECIEEKGYWARAAEQMALGALTDEVTLAGTIGEIGLGFTNLDLPMDIRDITADLTVNFEPAELSWWGMMGLDCLAFLPAIGAFKYTDDAGTLVNRGVKSLKKNLDELGTGAKKAVNSLDHIIRAGKGKTDDIAGYVKTLTNRAEKKLDQVKKVWAGEEAVEGGLGIIEGGRGALGTEIPKAANLKNSQTVQNHMNDIIKKGQYKGELSRPYIDTNGTNLLLDEIMGAASPTKDTVLNNGLRWDVAGSFRGSEGTWELVVDLDTNTIVHFNFTHKWRYGNLILLNKSYEDKIIEGYIIYNEEEKSFDTIPKLNTDIQLVISYINIGFDSETMIANQIWGFLPKDCWIESEIECPLNLKKATLKLKTELEPGSWRLDRGNQWKAYYNSKTKWICIGTPEIVIGDEYIVFLENAVSALNSSGELKALWMRV